MKGRQFSTKGQIFLGFFNCKSCDQKWCEQSEYLQRQPCPSCKNKILPLLLKKIYQILYSDQLYKCIGKCRHGDFTLQDCRINEKYVFCQQCNVKKFADEVESVNKNQRNINKTQVFIYAKFRCQNQQCQHRWEKRDYIKLQESKKCPKCNTETYPQELQKGKYFEENIKYHGIFYCDCKNTWSSRYSWLNETQQCEICVKDFYFANELKVVNKNINSTLYQKFTGVFNCTSCYRIWEIDSLKYGETDKCCGFNYFPYLIENDQISFNDNDKYQGKYECDCQFTWKKECHLNEQAVCEKCQLINYPKELKLIKITSTKNQIFRAFFECNNKKCKLTWQKDKFKYGQSSKCPKCNDKYFPYLLENNKISFNDKDRYNGKFKCQCKNQWQSECLMNEQIKCQKCKNLNLAQEIELIRNENHQQEKCSKCLKLGQGKLCSDTKNTNKFKINESQYKLIGDVNNIQNNNKPSQQRQKQRNQRNMRNNKKKPQPK